MANEIDGGTYLLSELQIKGNPKKVGVDSDRVRGGAWFVATIEERDAIPEDCRKEAATLCYVADHMQYYALFGGIENTHWQAVIPTGFVSGVASNGTTNIAYLSQKITINNTSTGNIQLAINERYNGKTMTVIIKNNDSISRNVLLPATDEDLSGNKTIAIAAGKVKVLGCLIDDEDIGYWTY
ncbi:hypothetical protein SAMN05421780_11035 [Flexibacter flexilis DSM 6793]|uniref:Uncharacterized protein n=1 Tax=Flexibacter flexilis DSM 6793 TaxID=927664 RepID=A0A1I1M6V6_9BACT|nr:hypothetical protein [Flexibacter flexilis]SFC80512.1 hypothetical protein SAMN05421780_11035 [Flexibacter flexilis DSM 6793]